MSDTIPYGYYGKAIAISDAMSKREALVVRHKIAGHGHVYLLDHDRDTHHDTFADAILAFCRSLESELGSMATAYGLRRQRSGFGDHVSVDGPFNQSTMDAIRTA